MQVLLNDTPLCCTARITLSDLLAQLGSPGSGTAVAVNQQIIPRDRWDQILLQDADAILLFNVVAGG